LHLTDAAGLKEQLTDRWIIPACRHGTISRD